MQRWLVVMLVGLGMVGVARADDELDEIAKVEPAPGRDRVQPMAPDWCPADLKQKAVDKSFTRMKIEELARGIRNSPAGQFDVSIGELDTLSYILEKSCEYPTHPYTQKQVAMWRQRWINATGLSEKEDRALLKYFVRAKPVKADIEEFEKKLRTSVNGESASFRAMHVSVNPVAAGKEDFTAAPSLSRANGFDHAVWMDNPLRPVSMMERVGFVHRCIPMLWPKDSSSYPSSRNLALEAWAYCGNEAEQIDLEKLKAEVTAKGGSPAVVARYTQYGAFVKAKAATAKALVESTYGSNANVKPWMNGDKYKEGWAEWQKMYSDNKNAFDAAFTVENKLDAMEFADWQKDQQIGCDPLKKAWIDYATKGGAKSKKPGSVADVALIAYEPTGYFLLSHLALCHALEGKGHEAMMILSLLSRSPKPYGGPHLYAMAHIFDGSRADKIGELSPDFFKKSLGEGSPVLRMAKRLAERTSDEIRDVTVNDNSQIAGVGSSEARMAKAGNLLVGRVQTVKKTPDGTAVIFKKETWFEPRYSCVNTGISQYQSDGTPIYYRNCKLVGSDKMELTPSNRTFVGDNAAEIKIGSMLKFAAVTVKGKNPKTGDFAMLVERIEGPAKKSKSVSYLGVPLKQ